MPKPSPSPSPDSATPPREEGGPGALDVVYLLGAHRSGSTIVGAILASVPGAFFLGEAYRFPRPLFWPMDPEKGFFWPGDPTVGCSCGAPGARCPFWSEVRSELERRAPFLQRLEEGQRRYEHWTSIPARLAAVVRHDPKLDEHLERHMEFLRVIADRAGARVLIDGSFNAVRGSLYRSANLHGGRTRFIHMVRDGRNFIGSEITVTWDPETPWRWVRSVPVILARWLIYNLASLWLWVRDPSSYIRVRYEDVVRKPEETLRRLGRFLGVDYTEVAAGLALGQPVEMRHIVAGNRVRLLGRVALRPHLAEPPPLSRRNSAAFWAIAGWFALLLGYRPGTRRR